MTRVLILAAGDATRWDNYLNRPKHFVTIEGEPVIHRAVRLLIERGINDVIVVGPDDPCYRIDGARLFTPTKTRSPTDKYENSRHLWNDHGRTIILYGDTYYTDACMDTVLGDAERVYRMYYTLGPNKLTGHRWGEAHAHGFWPEHHEAIVAAIEKVKALHARGRISKAHSWQIHMAYCGRSAGNMNAKQRDKLTIGPGVPSITPILDFTDDFDWPEEYRTFLARTGLQP